MASDTVTQTQADTETETGFEPWQAGLVGGIAGSLVFGAMMAMMDPAMLEMMIPMMYGQEGGLIGWIIHISHGAVLGVAFAALLVAAGQTKLGIGTGAGAGLAYGIVLWAILAVVVMPIWLGMAEMVPNLDMGSLVGHILYGVILGVVYVTLEQ